MSNSPTGLHLDVHDVGVRIGATQILEDIRFRLYGGELCALIGPSGAGKSTLIKVLLGLRTPSTGAASLDDRGATSSGLGAGRAAPQPASHATRPIGYVPQDDAVHMTLTVADCLGYAAELRLPHLDAEEQAARVAEVVRQVGLEERLNLVIKKLSGGQRKRVSVALELLTEPALLILDEPTSGLDPGLESRMMGLFANVAAQGRVVLVATHAMESIDRCQALLVLVRGRVAYFGAPGDALAYFRTSSYAGLFEQLHKQPPQAWARANTAFPASQRFANRTGPQSTPTCGATRSDDATPPEVAQAGGASAPSEPTNEASTSQPTNAKTPTAADADADADDPAAALAALKKQMGIS